MEYILTLPLHGRYFTLLSGDRIDALEYPQKFISKPSITSGATNVQDDGLGVALAD